MTTRRGPSRGRRPRLARSYTIDAELAVWVEEVADERVVGRGLVVEAALRLLRSAIEGGHEELLRDVAELPGPPR